MCIILPLKYDQDLTCFALGVSNWTNIFFAWQIVTKNAIHYFASLSEKEMSDWIAAFQSVVFKDDCSRHTIEEDNDLYCSSGEGECFILTSNIC